MATEINMVDVVNGRGANGRATLAECDAASAIARRLRDAGYAAEDQDRIACGNALLASIASVRRTCPAEQRNGYMEADFSDGPVLVPSQWSGVAALKHQMQSMPSGGPA